MSARATRTVNPLHFEDLEPHRFEDLVRQLAYGFRSWRSIEAIGRLGSDEGIDIRALEGSDHEIEPTGDENPESAAADRTTDRLWVFQCKRERRLGPSRVRRIVEDAVHDGSDPPYGFVLAAPCDFSLKARSALHSESRARGVQESHVWGKAELEDMLFLPANDHLLFAYFGISLQVKRRSLRTELRSRLATKRALVRIFGKVGEESERTVLLRDPVAEPYPGSSKIPDFAAFPRWLEAIFSALDPPGYVRFVVQSHYAYMDDAAEHWDAIFEHAILPANSSENLCSHPHDELARREYSLMDHRFGTYWNKLASHNRGLLRIVRCTHFDRILAIDEDGDFYHTCPHLMVEFNREHGPFEPQSYRFIEGLHCFELIRDETARVKFFPSPIPDEDLSEETPV
jgi:hypothetical protein